MRRFLLALALCAVPGCFLNIREEDDPPPIANDPCKLPAEPPMTLKDGPYGSGVEQITDHDVYPSFKSDYPKSLFFDRAKGTARIEYVHEGKAVVEQWKVVGALTSPVEGACGLQGHERGNLQFAGVTIDGVTGELAPYAGLSAVTLMAGASVTYRHTDGRELTVNYRHGFAPIFTTPCPFNRPVDGDSCNETAICAYDKIADHCTTRCASGKWQSFACGT